VKVLFVYTVFVSERLSAGVTYPEDKPSYKVGQNKRELVATVCVSD
jgi:hypothetical protein